MMLNCIIGTYFSLQLILFLIPFVIFLNGFLEMNYMFFHKNKYSKTKKITLFFSLFGLVAGLFVIEIIKNYNDI